MLLNSTYFRGDSRNTESTFSFLGERDGCKIALMRHHFNLGWRNRFRLWSRFGAATNGEKQERNRDA